MKKTKLIQVEVKGRSGFSGGPITFKRWVKPSAVKSLQKETKGMGKGFGVRKTGKTKTTRAGWLYD